MTVFTKPPLNKIKDVIQAPLVRESICDEDKVEVYPSAPEWDRHGHRKASGLLLCMFVMALLVTSAGVVGGILLYRQYALTTTVHRFQGFCTIPIDDNQQQLIEPHFRVMPLSWAGEQEPEAQVLSALEGPRELQLEHLLRELFEVDADVERVLVAGRGPPTSLIHDFKANASGIIEEERCFVMDMDPEFVLPPAVFVLSARGGGGEWDVSRVSSAMRATLPPLEDLARFGTHIAERCQDRPTYRLDKDDNIIKKRSTERPHLTQFSGRHVQDIHVDNMAELLHFESGRAANA